ncbi:hypothetical protein EXIGLDRAFT_775965 [Exidia glandulosa HHB12029]|uniref:Uncharacterized protein n=1 Tax=Exidia glandulosa HHB12029 TaxID=1314781 RepID=A0A165DP79_EXIGL|nr:hypothetical protein EXIGLDRAFT_775965 [Exidia glandulosa HHB12029]
MSGPGQWTVGGILPPERIGDRDRGSCIQTMVGTAQRRVGFVWRSSQASGRGDGRIGFYIAIDLDPDLPPDSDTHNVFIFAVHTADQHSRVNINLPAKTTLRGLTYMPYTPAADDAGTPLPGSRPDLPPAGDNTVSTRTNIQFIAHAHAGIMRYSVWTEFLHQQPSGNAQDIVQLRGYTSISFLHFYIQSEREWDGYPRERYLDGGNNGT